MPCYKKIFAALDGGDTQPAVARRALAVAHDNHAEVMFGHAVEAGELQLAHIDTAEIAETVKQNLVSELEKEFAAELHDECIPSVSFDVRAGRINDVLVAMTEDYEPDLVVCGVRGLSNVKYAFMGSVSTYLVRHMNCDILVVNPGEGDDE